MGHSTEENYLEASIAWGCRYLNISRVPVVEYALITSNGQYNSKTETVTLSNKCDSLLETLFHELVHHKQHEMGWLKERDGLYFWKKKQAKGNGYTVHDLHTYLNCPHERQARDLAKVMLKKYNEEVIK